jgi:hypothetical protein
MMTNPKICTSTRSVRLRSVHADFSRKKHAQSGRRWLIGRYASRSDYRFYRQPVYLPQFSQIALTPSTAPISHASASQPRTRHANPTALTLSGHFASFPFPPSHFPSFSPSFPLPFSSFPTTPISGARNTPKSTPAYPNTNPTANSEPESLFAGAENVENIKVREWTS